MTLTLSSWLLESSINRGSMPANHFLNSPPYTPQNSILLSDLVCHQSVWIVPTLLFNAHSFMLLHANGKDCVNISEHHILTVSERM